MFTLPIGDDNPTARPGFVTWLLIGLCVAVYLWQASLGTELGEAAVYALGVIPAVLFGNADLPHELDWVPPWASVITSMFLHGGVLHLAGNMLYLWIFGNNVEDAMGHGRFVLFYLLCGVAAALVQSLIDPMSRIPMIGASGAIAGVLGAYLLLHPKANVRVLVVIIFFVRVVVVPASIVLGLWFLMQILSGASTPVSKGGVAFWAHVGGFVAGLLLLPFFKRRDVALLAPPRTEAFAVLPGSALGRGSVPPAGRRPGAGWPPGPWR
jgi:membrane associated rhomboid family serine protease